MTQPPNTVPMLDVSASQGDVDWAKVYAAGYRAVMVEHGVGNDSANPYREAQVRGAQAAGLRVGRYDFAYPIGLPGAGRTPQQQAALHASQAVSGVVYDLPACLDLEWPEIGSWARWGCTANQIVQWVMAYSIARPEVTRLYVSPGFLAELNHPREFLRFDLWLAAWTSSSSPSVPAPFTSWSAWQYSAIGNVPGVSGDIDLSWLAMPFPPEAPTCPDVAT